MTSPEVQTCYPALKFKITLRTSKTLLEHRQMCPNMWVVNLECTSCTHCMLCTLCIVHSVHADASLQGCSSISSSCRCYTADIGGQGHPDASPTPLLILPTWNIPILEICAQSQYNVKRVTENPYKSASIVQLKLYFNIGNMIGIWRPSQIKD